MNRKIFVTGISTDVGKTLVAAVLVEALKADYWKPIQAGDLEYSDTDRVKALVSNHSSKFHKNTYAFKTPMSPHAAAAIEDIKIDIQKFKVPNTNHTLVIEGAGGVLVPINNKETILEIIPKGAKVVVVSRHYLGSINHTLMTLQILKQKGFDVSLVFSGDQHTPTEEIIEKMTAIKVIGRIDEEKVIDKLVVKKYADQFKGTLNKILKE